MREKTAYKRQKGGKLLGSPGAEGDKTRGTNENVISIEQKPIKFCQDESAPAIQVDFEGPIILLLDSGALPNLLKEKCMPANINIDQTKLLKLNGITSQVIYTLGKAIIKLNGTDTEFHIVPNNFSLEQDGLLGTEFFSKNNAENSYADRCLIMDGKKFSSIVKLLFHHVRVKSCK